MTTVVNVASCVDCRAWSVMKNQTVFGLDFLIVL